MTQKTEKEKKKKKKKRKKKTQHSSMIVFNEQIQNTSLHKVTGCPHPPSNGTKAYAFLGLPLHETTGHITEA